MAHHACHPAQIARIAVALVHRDAGEIELFIGGADFLERYTLFSIHRAGFARMIDQRDKAVVVDIAQPILPRQRIAGQPLVLRKPHRNGIGQHRVGIDVVMDFDRDIQRLDLIGRKHGKVSGCGGVRHD